MEVIFNIPVIMIIICLSRSNAKIDQKAFKILPVREQVLWNKGLEDVAEYRIPVITSTASGYLIAACEARKNSGGDSGPKFLAVRRSLDGGHNWEPQQFLLNDGIYVKDGLNLGAILTDRVTGTVFINYVTCAHHSDPNCTNPTVHMINSTDEGVTWNEPINMSDKFGIYDFAGGPGYGIQKQYPPHKGRLIICGHQALKGTYCILSDDNGKTWRYNTIPIYSMPFNQSAKAGDFSPNECQIVELSDGSIMLNARNQYHFHCACRMVAMSFDGADTFPVPYTKFDETLIDPACAAGLLYHEGVLFFVNAKDPSKRQKLTLHWSFSEGNKWDDEYQLWPFLTAYSTLTSIPDVIRYEKYIYILYEKGTKTESCEKLTLHWSFSEGGKWDDEYELWPKLTSYSTITAIPNKIAYEKYIYILYEKGTTVSCESLSLFIISIDGSL